MRKLFIYGVLIASSSLLIAAAPRGTVEIGKAAPAFTAKTSSGKSVSLSDYKGKYVVLEWYNPDCPFVRRHYGMKTMQSLQQKYGKKGVVWLSICSSARGQQGNMTGAAHNARLKQNGAMPKALLIDESGAIGRQYGAQTTPHMYVINPQGKLIYNGGIDNQPRGGNPRAATNYVAQALDEAMAGKRVSQPTSQPYGCNVKYAN